MELNNKSSIEETKHIASLREAWNRFVDDSCTLEDLKLLMDSVKNDENLLECQEILSRIWDESFKENNPISREQREKYRKEAVQLRAEFERNQKMQPTPIPSRTITRFRKIWYAAAAVLLFGMLIPAVQLLVKPKTEQVAIHYINEATGRGEIKTIVLPDQTKVTLNAESRLTYPDVFTGERSVELLGEAIFDVTHDSDRPFTVATADMNVKVLGTVFDVKAYPEDGLLMVSVASGKVLVNIINEINENILLEKDRQLKINKATGNHEKLTINAENYLSWTDGSLYFYQTPIKEVVNMLNRSYPQLVFELVEDEYSNLISGILITKDLETMLTPIIQTFGLEYIKTGNKIILYNDKNN